MMNRCLGSAGKQSSIVSVSFGSTALFKWNCKSCPSNEGNSCWLGHGDALVMDGQCQDEFRHCTDPGSDQERINNITFRWVKQHVAPCSFFKDRHGMLFANVHAGFFSLSGTELVEKGSFGAFLASPWCLVHLGSASFC